VIGGLVSATLLTLLVLPTLYLLVEERAIVSASRVPRATSTPPGPQS
jgi:hypothetical protein